MDQTNRSFKWGVLGASQVGASHIRHGIPNQDCIGPTENPDGSIILVVSDGHGSPRSFRSDIGSRLAVQAAIEVCKDFIEQVRDTPIAFARNQAEQQIPRRILKKWEDGVRIHHELNGFSPEEQLLVGTPDRYPIAYGATLLVAFATQRYLVAFQLGDGDILAVSDETGEVSFVIEKDPSLIANETTSLCQKEAWKYFRFRFHLFESRPPALILISSDGYSNSFATTSGFRKTGIDFLDILTKQGPEWLASKLPQWLEEASCEGSGDDISVGIIYRKQPAIQVGFVGIPIGESSEPSQETTQVPVVSSHPNCSSLQESQEQQVNLSSRTNKLDDLTCNNPDDLSKTRPKM
jgi:hypothetical protein